MIELISTFELIEALDWLRIFLLYSHLVLCVFAISAVLKTDVLLFLGEITREELERTAKTISTLLLFLWVSGLAIIYIDTGFEPAVLMTKSKLLIKLMCVTTLTLNGIVLHHISFPVLTKNEGRVTAGESLLLVITGGLSTSHWLLAAFVGMSKPLALVPFSSLFIAYCIVVVTVMVTSLFFIPILTRLKPVYSRSRLIDHQI